MKKAGKHANTTHTWNATIFNTILYRLKFKLKHEPSWAHLLIRKALSLDLQRGGMLCN